jgi:hypothetical protein
MVLLCIGTVACGGGGKTSSASHAVPTTSSVATGTNPVTDVSSSATSAQPGPRGDGDSDYDNRSSSYYDADDYNTPNYPTVAGAADKQAVTGTVKRYFHAAAANDGVEACSMIYSLFAETIPETLGEPPTGSPDMRGKTCAEVMAKFFKLNHKQLVAELATLEVTSVRTNGMRGLALLRYKGIHPHSIQMHLERGVWKIDETIDVETS